MLKSPYVRLLSYNPLMAQFTAIKQQYPDALVMVRLGDFYEMMGEDAEKAAPVLEITLTSRPISKGQRIHALPRASQTSGYALPDDDPYLKDTFGPKWIQMIIE